MRRAIGKRLPGEEGNSRWGCGCGGEAEGSQPRHQLISTVGWSCQLRGTSGEECGAKTGEKNREIVAHAALQGKGKVVGWAGRTLDG
eukprot:1699878-Rhodomonas_salina.1